MRTYDKNTPLLSIHIPKCGGISLTTTLKEWYGDNLLLHYYNERETIMPKKYKFKKRYSYKYKKNICVHGHFNGNRGFGVDDYYPEIKQAITFLRDPLEIALSVFHFNQRRTKEGDNYRDGKKREITNDIDEFLENANSYIKFFIPKEMSLEKINEYFDNYFIHVGVVEHFQKSIDILAEKLNKAKVIISHENISERLVTPSQSSIIEFKNRCSFEYKIYEKALKTNNIV
jgi:hypothetical protein